MYLLLLAMLRAACAVVNFLVECLIALAGRLWQQRAATTHIESFKHESRPTPIISWDTDGAAREASRGGSSHHAGGPNMI